MVRNEAEYIKQVLGDDEGTSGAKECGFYSYSLGSHLRVLIIVEE